VRGDDRGQFDGGCGHEPHTLPGIEVPLRERERAGNEFVGERIDEDLLAEIDQLADRSAVDERQSRFSSGGHVLEVLRARQHELRLGAGEAGDLRGGEEPLASEACGEVEQARTAHQGVVDVEERGGLPIALRCVCGRWVDLGCGDRCRSSRCATCRSIGGEHRVVGRRTTLTLRWIARGRHVRQTTAHDGRP